MAITARAFSDALKSAMIVEKPLWLTLTDGRQHRVLLPVSINEGEVAFADPHVDQRIVVAWKEIASLDLGGQGAAPHDRVIAAHDPLRVLVLKVDQVVNSARGGRALARPTR